MCTSSRLRFLATALIFVVGIGTGARAWADKVDWSQYIEQPGSKRPLPHPTTAAPQIAKPGPEKPDKKAATKTAKTKKAQTAAKGKTATKGKKKK